MVKNEFLLQACIQVIRLPSAPACVSFLPPEPTFANLLSAGAGVQGSAEERDGERPGHSAEEQRGGDAAAEEGGGDVGGCGEDGGEASERARTDEHQPGDA